MKLKNLYLILSFFIAVNFIQAQSNSLQLDNTETQIGIDYKNEEYLVFNNFTNYFKRKFNSTVWEKVSFKSNQMLALDKFDYDFFHIKGKNYLVYNGCGEVYELINDSIIRIDKSFQHKNQFNSNHFVYNNEIYFWGGYGLFTHKNILTKFDFKTKEWEHVKYNDYSKIPEPRQGAMSFLKNDFLYIVSGYTDDYETKQTTGNSKQLNDIWKLNLKTREWDFIGTINNQKELLYNFNGLASFQTENQLFYDNNRLFEFDFDNNSLKFTEPKDKYYFSKKEKYNSKTKEVIYLLTSSQNPSVIVTIEPFSSYSSNFTNETSIVINRWIYFSIVISVFNFGVLFFFYISKRKKDQKEELNAITCKNNAFYHKEKTISNLTNDEKELLNNYISDALLWFTLGEMVTLTSYQFFSKGVLQKSAEESQNPSKGTFELLERKFTSNAEFYKQRLVDYLIENKNKISSREQILNATSLDFNTKNRTIDMHISNIRAKIGDDSKNPKYIKSVWGIGYKFVG